MATKRVRLTSTYQDIAEGAGRVIMQLRDAGDVEIFSGPAPAAGDLGMVVNGGDGINGTCGYFDLPAADGLFARTSAAYGSMIEIVVIQTDPVA